LDGGLDIRYDEVNDLFTNVAHDETCINYWIVGILEPLYYKLILKKEVLLKIILVSDIMIKFFYCIDFKKNENFKFYFFYLDLKISSIYLDFQNIRVCGLWKQPKVRKQGLSNILSAENLLIDIIKIDQDVYKNYPTSC